MATPLPTSERFFAPGVTKFYWVPAIASASLVPTRIELDAGDDLTAEVADITGWLVSGEAIPTPDFGTTFTSSVPGRTNVDSSSLTLYADKAGADVRDTIAQGDNGFMVIADGGDVTAYPADVFPARVLSVGKVRASSGSALTIQIMFTVTAAPASDVVLPATA